ASGEMWTAWRASESARKSSTAWRSQKWMNWPAASGKIINWRSNCDPEFIKRAGFALMAYLAYRDKQAADAQFRRVLPLIEREAYDDRNFVRKAVNWAFRNIGKRNLRLNREATRTAARIRRQDSPSARWIAANALRELKSAAVQARLRRRASAGQ